jgi:hypothetical protein
VPVMSSFTPNGIAPLLPCPTALVGLIWESKA